jgi:PTH1 family peptidyl-tRNA hydrolase
VLILGLGNPGPEYEETRHNVGFAVVDELARRAGASLGRTRHRARYETARLLGRKVLLAQPLTYMNRSGEAARPLLEYHGMGVEDLIVVHDDADLDAGDVRVKRGGGTAGHKGLTSLVAHLSSADFVRVRIGVGRAADGRDLADWVLSRPGAGDLAVLRRAVEDGADAVEAVLADGVEIAMNRFNRRGPEGERT